MNIDELQAGRELDALIAEKVIGLEFPQQALPLVFDGGEMIYYREIELPHYSTDIAAAWQVVKKVKQLHNVCLSLEEYQFDGKHWQASFKGKFDKDEGKWDRLDYAFADTPELAICRAALKVVAIES